MISVKDEFPGLASQSELDNYMRIVVKNIFRGTAICVNSKSKLVGVMLYSFNSKCISFMAVDPSYRCRGVASNMMDFVMSKMRDISVTTFRSGASRGIAARA